MNYRVEFRLSMPGRASWNGRWSGEDKNFTIVKTIGKKWLGDLGLSGANKNHWSYHFSDGWAASVEATVLGKGVRAKKSDGFCGYDWMVDTILHYGAIMDSAQVSEWHAKQKVIA